MEDVATRLRVWLPVVLYCAAIFIASALPAHQMPDGRLWRFDKLMHCLVYGGLGLVLLRAFRHGLPRPGTTEGTIKYLGSELGAALASVACAGLYGVTDELHQSFVPGRQASGLDVAADLAGAALAVGAASWLRSRRAARAPRT